MPTKPSQREYEAVAALRTALRRFLHATDRVTRMHGLTAQRYDLLAMLRAAKPGNPTIKQLAEQLALAPHSVTELVDRAEEAGLVRRLDDEDDRRVARVALTAEGANRFAAAVVALRPERKLLLDLLSDVYDHARLLQPMDDRRSR